MSEDKSPWTTSKDMERNGFTLDTDIDSAPSFDEDGYDCDPQKPGRDTD